MLIFLIIVVFYLGWGVYFVIEDFVDMDRPKAKIPMYVLNFREGRDRIFSIIVAGIKILFWPLIYVVKFF